MIILPTLAMITADNAVPVAVQPYGAIAQGVEFTCIASLVWDGDGPIWCDEVARIRLAGISARELDNSCRNGHPCPAATGIAVRDHLVLLLGGGLGMATDGHVRVRATLHCPSTGSAGGQRTGAWCKTDDGDDLSSRMVKDGFAEV